jgi:hypothetical protein
VVTRPSREPWRGSKGYASIIDVCWRYLWKFQLPLSLRNGTRHSLRRFLWFRGNLVRSSNNSVLSNAVDMRVSENDWRFVPTTFVASDRRDSHFFANQRNYKQKNIPQRLWLLHPANQVVVAMKNFQSDRRRWPMHPRIR